MFSVLSIIISCDTRATALRPTTAMTRRSVAIQSRNRLTSRPQFSAEKPILR